MKLKNNDFLENNFLNNSKHKHRKNCLENNVKHYYISYSLCINKLVVYITNTAEIYIVILDNR